jgi:hypothetical protein
VRRIYWTMVSVDTFALVGTTRVLSMRCQCQSVIAH